VLVDRRNGIKKASISATAFTTPAPIVTQKATTKKSLLASFVSSYFKAVEARTTARSIRGMQGSTAIATEDITKVEPTIEPATIEVDSLFWRKDHVVLLSQHTGNAQDAWYNSHSSARAEETAFHG
jgi:hypothetical protein